jgi:hypothetical protein
MFAVIESTENIEIGPYTIRVWRQENDVKNIGLNAALVDDICNFVKLLLIPQNANVDDLLFDISEKWPDVSAIEVQLDKVTIYKHKAVVRSGVVVYKEWP